LLLISCVSAPEVSDRSRSDHAEQGGGGSESTDADPARFDRSGTGTDPAPPSGDPERAEREQPEREQPERERSGRTSSGETRMVAERRGASTSPGGAILPEYIPRDPVERSIDRIIASMPLEDRAGQLFMAAIITDARGRPVVTVDEDVREFLRTVRPGGVILFGANLIDPEQTRTLVRDLQAASPYPLIIAVDQEGGVVSRLTSSSAMPATRVPSARRIGLTGDEELAYQVGLVTGRELRSLGITMNFAPVADILTNPENPVIGTRAFGSDPDLVSRMVAATVRGLQDSGVSAVLKHFPGHGDTAADTHLQGVTVAHDLDRLRMVEFNPFRAGFDAGADGVMTAHIGIPGVTGDNIPATLSPQVLRSLLRDELSFDGVIVTDSLIMGALALHGNPEDLPVAAFRAGADMLLYPPVPKASHRRFVQAVVAGEIPEEALDEAVRRILRIKFSRGLLREAPPDDSRLFLLPERFFPETSLLGIPEHQELMDRVYRLSR
jgi:beta-N-acetylhexosaminidase